MHWEINNRYVDNILVCLHVCLSIKYSDNGLIDNYTKDKDVCINVDMEKGMDVDRGILNWFVSSENIYNNNVIMTLF